MHQIDTLNHRVPHGALVMLERSAGKLARSVLRGEESREALFLPGGLAGPVLPENNERDVVRY